MSEAGHTGRWRETVRLTLAVVVVLVLVIVFFVSLVESSGFAGFPLGYVVAATGLPAVVALLVFWFARHQERIDRRHGLYEDQAWPT